MLLACSPVVESTGFEKSIVQTDDRLTTIRDMPHEVFRRSIRIDESVNTHYGCILVNLYIYVAGTVVVRRFYMTGSEFQFTSTIPICKVDVQAEFGPRCECLDQDETSCSTRDE